MLPFSMALVNGLPGQKVSLMIQRAIKVGNSIGVEFLQRLLGLLPQGKEMGGFDLVGTLDLLYYEEGIGKNLEVFYA